VRKQFRKRIKALARHPATLNAAGSLIALYVRFVGVTTRWRRDPADAVAALGDDVPVIIAMWHGQHLCIPLGWPKQWPGYALVARHRDGEINAIALEKLGIRQVRGSGANEATGKAVAQRGGVSALRAMLRTLQNGGSMALTADVPKIGGIVGQGIVTLAAMSGRPIYPLAVVTRNAVHLDTWDDASIALPFGKGAIVFGDKVSVARGANAEELEEARKEVSRNLDRAHARAYELVGGKTWRIRNGE
jgi:lysophospholipid acyltransferase (LPLAT)-like uncharacterized protein